jgi:hypothetical protein
VNINRDNGLIAAGTHFGCSGQLGTAPVGERSADHRYCHARFELQTAEVKIPKELHIGAGAPEDAIQ